MQNRLTQRIKQFTQTDAYKQFLLQLAQRVADAEGAIYLAPFDMKYADDIKAHLQQTKGKACEILENEAIKLGGLYCSNGKVSINETLDNRVESALAEIDLDDLI